MLASIARESHKRVGSGKDLIPIVPCPKRPKTEEKQEGGDFLTNLQDVKNATTWKRPPVPQMDIKKESITFQCLDIKDYVGQCLPQHPAGPSHKIDGARPYKNMSGEYISPPVPVMRAYGVTESGNSVMAHIHGFTPYLYCNIPPGFTYETHGNQFWSRLNNIVAERQRGAFKTEKCVLHVEKVDNLQTLKGYHGDKTSSFLKIYVALPTLIATTRGILEKGFDYGEGSYSFRLYEANYPFILRFMNDRKIVGCCWLEAPGSKYKIRNMNEKMSTSQLEIDIVYSDLISHEPNGEWQKLAPVRILSFDIECAGRKGIFPEPEHDPVIQIANVVSCYGDKTPFIRNVMVLNTCSDIAGTDVRVHKDERDLLLDWSNFIRESDVDVITGYNINGFDLPYLIDRAKTLKVEKKFMNISRILGVPAQLRKTNFQSAAFGAQEGKECTIEGRTVFDMLAYMKRNQKLISYSLNAVSAEFLGSQKEDVHHSIISDLQRGSADDRRRLAVYCLKDALLPYQLMDKLLVWVNYVEMARVTGVPMDMLLSRGQQIKVLCMIYRACKPRRLLVPYEPRNNSGGDDEVAYEGATVIEPTTGFYDDPVATLDFASLYPSIMMAHNLCYSTQLSPRDLRNYPEEIYEKTPVGAYFVRKEVKKGILPSILNDLLAARKVAKRDMALATDPMVKAVQNGRQLALKVSANSVYGFTGFTKGFLPCLAISSSVTSYGREMIETTKDAVQKKYTVANGYPKDAEVIYGDTDSVMVRFGATSIKETMDIGIEAAAEVSKLFPDPVKLEFEKIYFPYLLMKKKRYAGMYWTKPDKPDKMDCKGIETVRRDNCALVRQVINTCLEKILKERSVQKAIDFTKGVIADLLQNKIDVSLLVITKQLGRLSDYKTKVIHGELAKRMAKRDPATAPTAGDRVPYVIVQGPKNAKTYEKSEDPMYAVKHGLAIDTDYYLHQQLEKPLLRIFKPVLERPESLFEGEHTRIVNRGKVSRNVGIMAFAQKSLKCLKCSVPIKEGPVCKNHQSEAPSVYIHTLRQVNQLERKAWRLWTECQECQNRIHTSMQCSNTDCPIYYMRSKAVKDLEDMGETLNRFAVEKNEDNANVKIEI